MNIYILFISFSIVLSFIVFLLMFNINKKLKYSIQTKNLIAKQKEELKYIFNRAQVGLMYVNSKRIIIYCNQMLADIFAYDSPEEMQGMSVRALHLSEQHFIDYGKLNFDSLRMGVKHNIEYQLRKKTGESFWCKLSGTALDEAIPANLDKGVLWVITDISLRKQYQQDLEDSERRYRSLFKHNKAVSLLIDQKTKLIFDCNDKALEYYGYSYAQMRKKSINDINVLDENSIKAEIQLAVSQKQNLFHFKHRLADGSIRDVEVYSGPIKIDEKNLLYSIVFDITEYVKLQEEKQIIQERLSYAIQGGNDGLWDWNLKTNEVYYSPRWKSILGYKDNELENMLSTWEALVHPDDLVLAWQELERFLESHDSQDRFSIQFRMRHKEGYYVPILSRAQKQCDKFGKTVHLVGTHVNITELVAIQQAYKIERDRSQLYLDTAEVLLVALDTQARVTMLNRKGEELLGYSEAALLGKVWFEIGVLPAEISSNIKQFFQQLLKAESDELLHNDIEHALINRAGETLMFNFRSALLFDSNQEVIGLLSSGVDITERLKAQNALKSQHDFLQSVINSVADSIMVVDTNYNVTLMNEVAKKSFNPTIVADLQNPKCYEISHQQKHHCDQDSAPCLLNKVIRSKKMVTTIHTQQDTSGKKYHIQLTATPLFDKHGEVYSIIELGHDITVLSEAKKTLQHQAEHDALTGLPNRVLFLDRLQQSIKYAKHKQEKVALLFVDLDHFKQVNDSLGHFIGDKLLKEVARRFEKNIGNTDTVARLGGDEFAIIVEHVNHLNKVTMVADKLIHALHAPILISKHKMFIGLSIGLALYPDDGTETDTLLKNADAAMYKAKNSGRNNYQFYTEDMTSRALERVTLESQLRQSIEKKQMEVYYQIQVDAKQQCIIGMEALLRWHHPDQGLMTPNKFIPIAEDAGFIVELDEWVMLQAIEQWKKWRMKGYEIGTLSLNISMLQLERRGFIQRFQRLLQTNNAGLVPLSLEVTESQIMKNPQEAIKTFKTLQALGIKLSIDDFGTGYSSLAYLKKLPLDKLKIDRSFIKNIPDDNDDMEITRTIISMAAGLKLDVIAEGVETLAQKDFLLAQNCHEIQGYLYHKPASASDVETLLQNNRLFN